MTEPTEIKRFGDVFRPIVVGDVASVGLLTVYSFEWRDDEHVDDVGGNILIFDPIARRWTLSSKVEVEVGWG